MSKKAARVALAGKVFPSLSTVFEGQTISQISNSLHDVVEPLDIAIIVFLGWAVIPITRAVYRVVFEPWRKKEFDQTHTFFFINLFSQAVKVLPLVIFADCLDVVLTSFGVDVALRADFGYVTAQVAYCVWAALQFARGTDYLLSKAVESKHPDKLGRAKLLNSCINLAIFVVAAMFIVDLLDVEVGAGFASVFALGGVGTIIVSLASKDLAEQLLSGMFLHLSDKFYEGDLVKFGDGLSGTVFKIGWMHTVIRLSDDTRTRIPNAYLAHKTVTNLSRCTQCQVKTVLYFEFSDMDRLPALIKSIKEEVQTACPELIVDGSRPFRVHWTDITTDRLEVTCDFHFNLKPFGNEYLDNRQSCLQAIGAAMSKNKMECAVPIHRIAGGGNS